MPKLIIASDRLPLSIKKENNQLAIVDRIGGFASGLHNFHMEHKSLWVGWPGLENETITKEEINQVHEELEKNRCYPVYLSPRDISEYYSGFCSKTLWPLFHYFSQHSTFRVLFWNAYKRVNKIFANRIAELYKPGDYIWIHDYHLMLVPDMLRQLLPEASIGFFLHIPFPSFELFRILPWRLEILNGLLGADLIGFHTFDYERHFMSCLRRLMGLETNLNKVRIGEKTIKVDSFPLGIDYDRFHAAALKYQMHREKNQSVINEDFYEHFIKGRDKKVVLSVDRLDYAKGITDRLRAYEYFLNNYPRYLEKISLLLFIMPSKEYVEEYQNLKSEVDELVGRINGRYGTINWMPIWYFYRTLEFQELVEIYSTADIALVTPLRDGMNLIAKEYAATSVNGRGVIILSEMAGASKEMGESILVNPANRPEVAEAIKIAIEMPLGEQQTRMQAMQERLKRYNEDSWANHFIRGLRNIKQIQESKLTRKINAQIRKNILERFSRGSKRMIFLDYDGTLSGFKKDPQEAGPDEELYEILKKLTEDERNDVAIISGRDKETLGEWFSGSWNITFIAEHGVWARFPGQEWHMIEQIDKSWMDIVHPYLEFYVDRTPGSFIEEKNYSLVWHYRNADPDLGILRSWELKDELKTLVSNLNLEIMDGDKVIEIKNSGINKGRAALYKMGNNHYDFIVALGDDWTDEYTFEALPAGAITIKVGVKYTSAGYYVESVGEVRKLLSIMAGA
ncbi:MAG: bifunctional alpha,alpha-trehalose-phosphate synthase (UDP-forming)/trehalose-phosphatase [Bacteroidales bacterium]